MKPDTMITFHRMKTARLTILFDPSVTDHLPLDVIWALVALASARLAAPPGSAS